MFRDAAAFNQPLGEWDVSQVTNMGDMFWGAAAFDQPLANWKVGQVTDMCYMFCDAAAFNQPLADWDVSQVTNMNCMFRDAAAFDQPVPSWNWKVAQVTDTRDMFTGVAVHKVCPCPAAAVSPTEHAATLASARAAALLHKPLTPAQAAALAEANRRWTNEKHREVDPPPQLQPKAADEEGQPAADQGHTKRIKRSAADNEQPSTGEVIQTVGEGPGPTPALTGESDCITSPAADNEQPSTGEVIQTVGEGPGPTPALTGESVCITSPVGGCVVAAVAVLLGLPDENVRHLLQTKLREMNQHGSVGLGNAESDLYHVTVATEVLKAQGKQVERVRPEELHHMFQKGAKVLLLGRLNFNFQPYKQRTTNSKVRSPSQFLQALPNHTARVPVYCWCSADRVADPRLQEG